MNESPCKRGHTEGRYSNGTCKTCNKAQANARNAAVRSGAITEKTAPSSVTDFATEAELLALTTGDDESAVKALKAVRERAASKGWAPEYGWKNPVPDPHVAKGVSTLYGADGTVKQQWVKSDLKDARLAEMQNRAIVAMLEALPPRDVIPEPALAESDLCNVYLLGDPHFGMLAWAAETHGADWDLKIAEDVHSRAIERLVADAPKAGVSLVANMGDALHADNYDFLTQSGHRLDADSRLPRAIQVAVRSFRRLGDLCAASSKEMHWLNVSGNHDRNAAPWFDMVLDAYWHANPRITVDMSPASNLYYRHGEVLLGFTHGDRLRGRFAKSKGAQDFIAVMAHDRRADWGATKHHVCFQGHIHSANTIEATGGTLESVQTLAANDAWHAAQVYRSGKSMTRVTYHKVHGEIGRQRVPISMVDGSQKGPAK